MLQKNKFSSRSHNITFKSSFCIRTFEMSFFNLFRPFSIALQLILSLISRDLNAWSVFILDASPNIHFNLSVSMLTILIDVSLVIVVSSLLHEISADKIMWQHSSCNHKWYNINATMKTVERNCNSYIEIRW